MVRFLAVTALALIGNALGLIVAAWLLDDMELNGAAFVIAVGIFTLAYIILQPLVLKMALRYVEALRGGTALVSTLVALIVTDLLSDGLSISGATTWILATLIIWVVAVAASLILPLFLFKKALGRVKDGPQVADGKTWS